MSSLGSPSTFFLAKKKAYEVERSLRFNDEDSPSLTRSPSSSGNQSTFTFSWWQKITQPNDYPITFSCGSTSITTGFWEMRIGSVGLYLRFKDSSTVVLNSNDKFRDPSAWYHCVIAVDTTQATSSNRIKMYVNNRQITSFEYENYPSQNFNNFRVNSTDQHQWGYGKSSSGAVDGPLDSYLAEIHFIDGFQYDPSYFGETNPVTGQWNPKKYTGGYGTNGYYLNFSDNSSTSALGTDSSGNSNNWTPNNFVTGDSVKDSPTNNFATFRLYGTPAASGASLAEGNLKFTTGSSGSARNLNRQGISTFLPTSGKWYAEVRVTGGDENNFIGVSAYQLGITPTSNNSRYVYYYGPNGEKYVNTNGSESNSTHGAGYGNDDIVGIYIDMDAGTPTVYFSKNGQWADGSGNSDESTPTSGITLGDTFFTTDAGGHTGIGIIVSSSSGGSSVNYQANFGQDSTFSGLTTAGGNTDTNAIGDFKYAVPTGAKAMCTANLSDPTIKKPNQHFDTLLWTGNSTDNRAITGLNFQPDFTWIKNRSSTMSHFVVNALLSNTDSGGGNGNEGPLATNANGSASALTDGGFESFNSDGFTLGKGSSTSNADAPYQRNNASSETYVGWNWKGSSSTVANGDGSTSAQVRANASAGFSILTYTGTGSNATVGHGLGVAPKCFIVKRTDAAGDWAVYHYEMGTHGMQLNSNGAQANEPWWNGHPTSSVINLKTSATVNGSSNTYVAYVFSEVAGYSKFGGYVGNGNSDGTFVFTGFKPALIISKKYSGTDSWQLWDNKRDPDNLMHHRLFGNETSPESTSVNSSSSQLDFCSNGFKWRGSSNDTNGSGDDYLYLAFAESPFKYARAR